MLHVLCTGLTPKFSKMTDLLDVKYPAVYKQRIAPLISTQLYYNIYNEYNKYYNVIIIM